MQTFFLPCFEEQSENLSVLVAEPSMYIELEYLIECLICMKHEDASADWLLWYDVYECEKILSRNTGKVM